MERLEAKTINGHRYYYYSLWGWVNGKCRRIRQKYLGKPCDIARVVLEGGPAPEYAEVFQWGLPTALWKEVDRAEVVEITDALSPKRKQGLSVGKYLAVAAVNRAICPQSKRSMWEWFAATALFRRLPEVSESALTSQRFWDHMGRIDAAQAQAIWKRIVKGAIEREGIDLSRVSYDGTNFYTFIDTFNSRCQIAQRGKNKQGRRNLRQVSYALFCSADGHVPLFYDVYEGNRHDAKQFPLMIERFHRFLSDLSPSERASPATTVVFDKGNNSAGNFALLDAARLPDGTALHFVGSVKLDEHKALARISNDAPAFTPCCEPGLESTKALRVNPRGGCGSLLSNRKRIESSPRVGGGSLLSNRSKRKVYGKERVLVVTYNQNLFNAQWQTVQSDIERALETLEGLRQRLEDRVNGIVTAGKAPTAQSIRNQCGKILGRQHMKRVIRTTVEERADGLARLEYSLDGEAVRDLCDTWLGKNILVTSREDWSDDRIIEAYRSQFIIEDVFKEMKDRTTGTWWPMHHWTNSKIQVHGLYCTIAILLRALMLRRVRDAGPRVSMRRLLSELDTIREVVNIYPKKGRRKAVPLQTVLSRTSDLQRELMSILGIEKEETSILG